MPISVLYWVDHDLFYGVSWLASSKYAWRLFLQVFSVLSSANEARLAGYEGGNGGVGGDAARYLDLPCLSELALPTFEYHGSALVSAPVCLCLHTYGHSCHFLFLH